MRHIKLFIILIALIFFGTYTSAWFYENQPFRIPIQVTSPSVLTDYPILVDLNNTSLTGDSNFHFWLNTTTNGNDIRFSNQDDNQALDFFKEQFSDNNRAKFWVKIKNLTASDQNIYLYYGSQASDDNSNWENVFLDDGNGTTMSGWSTSEAGGSAWFSNGTQYQNDSTTGTQHMSKSRTFSNALVYAVSVEMRAGPSTDAEVRYYLFDEATTTTTYVEYNSGTNQMNFRSSGDGSSECSISITDGGLYDVNITRDYSGTWTMYTNNSSCSVQNTDDTSGGDHGFSHGGSAGTTTGYGDNIYLKKTNAGGEPTYSFFSYEDNNSTTMRVVDEETGTALQATVLINGSSVDVNANGYFDVNTSLYTFPITISASFTGYDSRTFSYLSSNSIAIDSTLGLRTASETKNIDFQFFGPDEQTKLSNRYIRVERNGIVSGRGLTSSSAQITFNLAPQDGSYDTSIFSSGSDTNVEYNYIPITLSVLRPINEKTNVIISSQWSVQLTGLGVEFQDANNASKTFTILGNTLKTYDFLIDDSNSTLGDLFFPRTYALKYKGDTNSESLQPYLVAKTDGSNVNFFVYDKLTNIAVPNLLVSSRRSISSSTDVLMEQETTNAIGLVELTFLNGVNYDLNITDLNQLTQFFPSESDSGSYNNALTSYNIYISSSTIDVNGFVYDWNIFVLPQAENILKSSSQRFDANVYTNYATGIDIRLYDGNTIIQSGGISGEDFNFTTTIATNNLDTNFLRLEIRISSQNRIDVYNQFYLVVDNLPTVSTGIDSLRNNTGLWGGVIITFAVIALTLQQYGSSLYGNNESQFFIVSVLLVMMGILFFFPLGSEYFFVVITAIAFGVIVYLKERGG